MTRCPDPSTLERLFQGTLASAEQAAVERHLDGCPECSATLAELARLFGSATWSGVVGSRPGRADVETEPSHATAGAPTWSSPTDLGRYRLGRRLGAGGMGTVFEAEDLELHRRVALKILHTDPGADLEHTRARLLREARAMAQTNHPNIVAVYDVGRIGAPADEGAAAAQVFLAMELVEGSTLTAWLRGRRPSEILAAFVMAGRGLAAAHATGLVHRDFKPDNVLIGADGRARVTDFGLALAARLGAPVDRARQASVDLRASMQIQTEQGTIVGTPPIWRRSGGEVSRPTPAPISSRFVSRCTRRWSGPDPSSAIRCPRSPRRCSLDRRGRLRRCRAGCKRRCCGASPAIPPCASRA